MTLLVYQTVHWKRGWGLRRGGGGVERERERELIYRKRVTHASHTGVENSMEALCGGDLAVAIGL